MVTLVTDPDLSAALIRDRQTQGIDQHDEVWEGVYVMSPIANDEHQQLVTHLAVVLTETVDFAGKGAVRAGINLASNSDDWKRDFRVPDVVVFLDVSEAICHGTYWSGGPDLAIEIVSPGDQTREKIPFYEKVGTRELLIVDRDPWQLELFRLEEQQLKSVGISRLPESVWLASESVPLQFRLMPGEPRPKIEVQHTSDEKNTSDEKTWCL